MKPHMAMVIGFLKTTLTDVRTAVMMLTSRSRSIGKDTTERVNTTTEKINPFGAPQFGAISFMITGFHGFHVSVGVIFLLITARKVWIGETVEVMGLYWHFVDLVWVFIFAFFYLW